MRVAYVCADPGVPVFGRKGSSVHVQEVVRAMRRHGADVTLFATSIGDQPPDDLKEVEVHPLQTIPKASPADRERLAQEANRDLREQLEESTLFDLLYERHSLWSFAGIEWAAECGVPSVLEVNAPLIDEQAEHRGLVDREAAERCAARAFGAAAVVAAVSAEAGAYARRSGADKDAVHVISNGVDAARFREGVFPSRPAPGVFTAGFLGTLKPWHGLEALAEAFAIFHSVRPASRLLIVGDGPGRASLEKDLEGRGAGPAVEWTGAVDPADVPPLLASMDAGIAPYPQSAGFYFSPLKVFEYMAAGIPVVATRTGQIAEVVEDGVTGILTEPGRADQIAAALARLESDRELARSMGALGRAGVLANHTWDHNVRAVFALAGAAKEKRS